MPQGGHFERKSHAARRIERPVAAFEDARFQVEVSARPNGPSLDAVSRQLRRARARGYKQEDLLAATPLASISSVLDELRSHLPHVELPRFPPVVRLWYDGIRGISADSDKCNGGSNRRKRAPRHTLSTRDVQSEEDVIALEITNGRKRVYKQRRDGPHDGGNFDMVQDREPLGTAITKVWSSFVMPQDYPSSVSPEYKEYMFWRSVQYFFGGAISVFTTKALLTAVGIKRNAGANAAAINWVVKDGAGRLGRFMFARWGHKLDCELKQFRLLGDALLEAGAVLELATAAAPAQFLPLACTANLLKNVAAVAASTTRAPIYRTFALDNNMADVTAKGESVANLSDIAGVAFGIGLSRLRWPMWVTITMLSLGYVIASRKEVDSVILPYMNQARLAYATNVFFRLGQMPSIHEGNKREPLVPLGTLWAGYGQVKLGASIESACESPAHLGTALAAIAPASPYVLTYRPECDRVFVMLREKANKVAALEGAFLAHLWLKRIHEVSNRKQRRCMPALPCTSGHQEGARLVCSGDLLNSYEWAQQQRLQSWRQFCSMAEHQGWRMDAAMLAIGNSRLLM